MESETFQQKADRLQRMGEQLENLRKEDYKVPVTPDIDLEGRVLGHTPEYDFEDTYDEPELAIALLIERCQLKHELVTGKRVPIITEKRASEIYREITEVQDKLRKGHLVQKMILPKRIELIEVRV